MMNNIQIIDPNCPNIRTVYHSEDVDEQPVCEHCGLYYYYAPLSRDYVHPFVYNKKEIGVVEMNRPNINLGDKHTERQTKVLAILYVNSLPEESDEYTYYRCIVKVADLSMAEYEVVMSDLEDLGLIECVHSIIPERNKARLTMKGRDYYRYIESGQDLE